MILLKNRKYVGGIKENRSRDGGSFRSGEGINTMILKNTEQSFIGRVNGILTPMFMGSMVVAMMLSG